jgi:hypothetical protein
MRILLAAAAVSVGALAAVGVLGVAGAETTTTTGAPPRTVSVQGVASAPVAPEASGATATAVYRQAMAGAVADGQAKAQYLAEKTAATLGPVQSVAEGGGSIECPGEEEYTGEQPDFGYASSGGEFVAGSSAPALARTPSVRKPAAKPPRKHKKRAKAAVAATCTLSTQVALSYQLG